MAKWGRGTAFAAGRRSGATVAALVLLTGSACADARSSATGATVPSGEEPAATSSTTAAPAPPPGPETYAVPEVIDQAYVQRVVSAYDQVLGNAIRVLKRDGAITEEFLSHLVAIYTEEEFETQHRYWVESVAQGDIEKRPAAPSDPVTRVLNLVEPTHSCVIARTSRNLSPTLNVEPEESPEDDYVVLTRIGADRDLSAINPTPWVMSFDGFMLDGSIPRNSCAA